MGTVLHHPGGHRGGDAAVALDLSDKEIVTILHNSDVKKIIDYQKRQ
jgi:hypothetical protein